MQIEYYISESGNNPSLKFLKKLPDNKHAIQIIDDIELLQEFSLAQLQVSGDVEKIKGINENIWELRTRCRGNMIYRTLFALIKNKIYILHIFNKKDQKIKKQEIGIAIARLKYLAKTYET